MFASSSRRLALLAVSGTALALCFGKPCAQPTFARKQLDNNKVFESTSVADFTGDGKADILSGSTLYEGPTWKKHDLGIAWSGYMDFEYALDVDGDGKMDALKGSTNNGSHWYRNVWPQTGAWPKNTIDADNKAHAGILADLDGDGKANEHIGVDMGAVNWFSLSNAGGKATWSKHTATTTASLKSIGAGDVNGDGKADIIRPDGWFENPGDPKAPNWKVHCLALGVNKGISKRFLQDGKCGQIDHTSVIHVYDVDKDGLNDFVTSSAHGDGVFWYRQVKAATGDNTFEKFVIDADATRTHSTALADLDGDGDQDFIVANRPVYGGDSQWIPNKPVFVAWYQLNRGATITWTRHNLATDEEIGSGTKMTAQDVDGDGDADIVIASMLGGPWILENKLDPASFTLPRALPASRAYRYVLVFDGGRMRLRRPSESSSLDMLGRGMGPLSALRRAEVR